jgi:hypothetical protein
LFLVPITLSLFAWKTEQEDYRLKRHLSKSERLRKGIEEEEKRIDRREREEAGTDGLKGIPRRVLDRIEALRGKSTPKKPPAAQSPDGSEGERPVREESARQRADQRAAPQNTSNGEVPRLPATAAEAIARLAASTQADAAAQLEANVDNVGHQVPYNPPQNMPPQGIPPQGMPPQVVYTYPAHPENPSNFAPGPPPYSNPADLNTHTAAPQTHPHPGPGPPAYSTSAEILNTDTALPQYTAM